PFQGLAQTPKQIFQNIQESTFVALDKLVRVAIQKEVDFVLLVGDLFDNERQSLKAQIRLRKAIEELRNYNISVYLSYGNHDHLNGNIHSVSYTESGFISRDESVSQLMSKRIGEALAIFRGFTDENGSVTEKKVYEYEVDDNHIPFHIAT